MRRRRHGKIEFRLAGGADDESVRLAREEALRLGVLLPRQRAGLDENLEALSAALLFLLLGLWMLAGLQGWLG